MVRCIVYFSAVPYNYSLQSCSVNSWCWNYIVLCTSCFYSSNKAVGALDIGEVGYLIAGDFALGVRGVVAVGGGCMPAVLAWLDVSLPARLHIAYAACIVEAGKDGVGGYVVGGGH